MQGTGYTIRFSAKATRVSNGVILQLPKSAVSKLPPNAVRGTMVEGTINGFPFRAVVDTTGSNHSHALGMSQTLHDTSGVEIGHEVSIELTRIGDEPECRVPRDFHQAIEASAASSEMLALWQDITVMARRDWILWICSAKQPETRDRRIENACDMMASGKRRPCCMPGINWRKKDYDIDADETWLPLKASGSRTQASTRGVKKSVR